MNYKTYLIHLEIVKRTFKTRIETVTYMYKTQRSISGCVIYCACT